MKDIPHAPLHVQIPLFGIHFRWHALMYVAAGLFWTIFLVVMGKFLLAVPVALLDAWLIYAIKWVDDNGHWNNS
jgi:hypothetical protein